VISSWNTDGGVSRHITPIVEYLHEQDYEIKVLTHYRYDTHGCPLRVRDGRFVKRCFSKTKFDLESLNELIELVKKGYKIVLLEDLGMLPMDALLRLYQNLKKQVHTFSYLIMTIYPNPMGISVGRL
jgi:hypothetical protein